MHMGIWPATTPYRILAAQPRLTQLYGQVLSAARCNYVMPCAVYNIASMAQIWMRNQQIKYTQGFIEARTDHVPVFK